jgi:plastocyanin
MRARSLMLGFIVLVAVAAAAPALRGHGDDDGERGNQKIELLDDCNPDDGTWDNVPGGCVKDEGDVSAPEFDAFLRSPLYDNQPPFGVEPGLFLVGHPSWRNDPSHIVIREGKKITVKNTGGRPHTLTPVAQFGAGRIPPLNAGFPPAPPPPGGPGMAPECGPPPAGQVDPWLLLPGQRFKITAAGVGIHRLQCCFHPWMRATVRVVEKNEHDHH